MKRRLTKHAHIHIALFCQDAYTSNFYLYGTNQSALQDVFIGFKNSYLTYMYWCDVAK